MSDNASQSLELMQQNFTAIDKELVRLAEAFKTMSTPTARMTALTVFRNLKRLAEATVPLTAACPTCGQGAKAAYEPVNQLSGVWSRPACPTCGELTELLTVMNRVAEQKAARRT